MDTRGPEPHRHVVLVVDDYAALREASRMFLERAGYVATCANSGPAALALLRAGHRPCLVLLDVCMPDMTGLDCRAAIGADPALVAIPIVLMSGSDDVLRLAGEAALVKPVDLRTLRSTVERYARCPAADAHAMAAQAAAMTSEAQTMAADARVACARASENLTRAHARTKRLEY